MADAPGDYEYNKTADATSLSGSPALTSGFPALIRLEEGTDSTGTGAGVLDSSASIDGKEDIGVFDQNDNPLPFYFEKFDSSNGVYEIRVNMDLVRDGSTQLKIGYGSGSTNDAGTTENVWDTVHNSQIHRAWGFNESSGDLIDLTSNNGDGTVTGATQGVSPLFAGTAYDLDGNDDRIDVGDLGFGGGGTQFAIIFSINFDDVSSVQIPIGNWDGSGDGWQLVMKADESEWYMWHQSGSNGDRVFRSSQKPSQNTTNRYMAYAEESSNNSKFYKNGTDDTVSTNSEALGSGNTSNVHIGSRGSDEFNTDGTFDDMYIIKGAEPSADWAQTEYDQTSEAGYTLFSWNASETTKTVSNSSPATASATPQTASNTTTSSSSSSPATATGTPVQAVNGPFATTVSTPASAQGTPTGATNVSIATSNSDRATASATPLVASNPIVEAPPIKYYRPRARVEVTESENDTTHTVIDSDDGSTNFLQGDLEIDGSVKSAVDSFSFELSNPNNRFSYISVNDEVEIYLGYNTPLTRVMRGLVTEVEQSYDDGGNTITIEGRDFGQLLQQRVAAEVYLNEKVGDIVRDLVKKYASDIDTSAVQDPGTTLESHRVAYDSLFDTIKNLADRENYQFYVDNDKKLHFEPKGFEASNHTFNSAGQIMSFDKTPNKDKIVNEAIVFGGKRPVREEETFSGDGSTKKFTTQYKPHDPDVFIGGTHKQGGAEGTTDQSEVDYVYDVDTREFTFTSAPASGTDNIQINYTRNIPIQAIKQNSSSISEYGKHQKRITDQNITRKAEAESIASSLVNEYGQPPEEISSRIVAVHELKAGQTATFDVPEIGVQENKLDIVGITYTWGEAGYTMDLTLNEEPADLSTVIREMKQNVQRTQGFDSGILDLIRKLQNYSDTMNLAESVDIDDKSVNDSFIIGSSSNSTVGTDKLGDRRGSYTDLVSK